jgi:hypothetical protein
MNPLSAPEWMHVRWSGSDSAIFVGYPKTGNTWTRFLVGRYIQLHCGTDEMPLFDSVDKRGRGEQCCIGPAIRFTHDPLTWETQRAADLTPANTVKPFRRHRVALLVRYPLDILVSSWHQAVRRDRSFDGDLESFIDDPVHGLDKLLRFYDLWRGRSVKRFCVVRYEDLRADTVGGLTHLLGFLGIEPALEFVNRAVADSSFDAMRRMEEDGRGPRFASSGLDVFATGDPSDPNAFHMRRGKIGGYRDELGPRACARFEKVVAREMSELYGYGCPVG